MSNEDGYSRWSLQPRHPDTAIKYRNYTRSQIRNLFPTMTICLSIISIIMFVYILVKGEFKNLRKKYTSAISYFFFFTLLDAVIAICWLISKKYPIAIEMVIPGFAVAITAAMSSAWYQTNPKTS